MLFGRRKIVDILAILAIVLLVVSIIPEQKPPEIKDLKNITTLESVQPNVVQEAETETVEVVEQKEVIPAKIPLKVEVIIEKPKDILKFKNEGELNGVDRYLVSDDASQLFDDPTDAKRSAAAIDQAKELSELEKESIDFSKREFETTW